MKTTRSAPRRLAVGCPALGVAMLLGLVTTPATAGGIPRAIFVTSIAGNGDLGSWPDAGGATGLAAADAICRARATAGGLVGASSFRAWISDDVDDAICRAHDLGGKLADGCGTSGFTPSAGPWVRSDGVPFGPTISLLLDPDNIVYFPPATDEHAMLVSTGTFVWTGTRRDGTAHGSHCAAWTAASGTSGRTGKLTMTSAGWTEVSTAACANNQRLLCLRTGSGPALPQFAQGGRVVFVTSVAGNGRLASWPDAGGAHGVAAGDAVCQARALAAGLAFPSSFRAWLSTETTGAAARLLQDGPWVRLDGARVAISKADLLDGRLETAITVTELGEYLPASLAWTGTTAPGAPAVELCADWTADTVNVLGRAGNFADTVAGWTHSVNAGCNSSRRIYCLSDAPGNLLFADGFESGGASLWSLVLP